MTPEIKAKFRTIREVSIKRLEVVLAELEKAVVEGLEAGSKAQDARDAEVEALKARVAELGGVIIAVVEDGWLYHGEEGMSVTQEAVYDAYEKIRAATEEDE